MHPDTWGTPPTPLWGCWRKGRPPLPLLVGVGGRPGISHLADPPAPGDTLAVAIEFIFLPLWKRRPPP